MDLQKRLGALLQKVATQNIHHQAPTYYKPGQDFQPGGKYNTELRTIADPNVSMQDLHADADAAFERGDYVSGLTHLYGGDPIQGYTRARAVGKIWGGPIFGRKARNYANTFQGMRKAFYNNRHIIQALHDTKGDPAKVRELLQKHPDAARDLRKLMSSPYFQRGAKGAPSRAEQMMAGMGRKGALDSLYKNWGALHKGQQTADWYHNNKAAVDQMHNFKNQSGLQAFTSFLLGSPEENQRFLRSLHEMNANPNSGWRKHFGDKFDKNTFNNIRPYAWLLQLISNIKGTFAGKQGWAATNYDFGWKNSNTAPTK